MTIAEFVNWIGSLSIWWPVAWSVGGFACMILLSVVGNLDRMARVQ